MPASHTNSTTECFTVQALRGSITIIKDAVPDDAQDFAFTTTGTGLSGFSLTDDGTTANTRTFSNLTAGTYSVAETVPTGWDLSNISCVDPTSNSSGTGATATINLGIGENVTCTFTNTQRGKIIVDKVTDPSGDTTAFTFDPSWSGTNFTLTDGDTPHDSGWLAPGTHSVAETVPTGWDLSSAVCSDGSDPSNIDVAAGETVTCTFTNTKRGKIIVVKETDPASTQTFDFTLTGDFSTNQTFSLVGGGTPHDSGWLKPGVYVVSETSPTGWNQTGATCTGGEDPANITLDAGQVVTCTFTNVQNGTLVIKKETVPDGDAAQFEFDPSWSETNFTLADGGEQSFSLAPATYSVAELALDGWDLTGLVCDDGSTQDPGTMTATVDLGAGETVECTFTNTKQAKILVDKVTSPSGDTTAFEFDPTWSETNFTLADGDTPHDSGWLAPGTYSVTELVPAGWALTGLTCDDGTTSTTATASVTLDPGDVVTCTFTNSKRGSITVVKDADPDGDTAFSFTGSDNLVDDPDNDVYSFTLTDDGTAANTRVFSNLAPGAYSISEIIPDGWDLSGPVCTVANANGGTQVVNGAQASINLAAGEDVTCTFTNTLRRGQIIIEKQTLPDGSGATFDFTASYDGDGFSLSDGQTNNSGPLLPGTYTVAEVVPTGWDLTGLVCVETGTENSTGSLATGTASITLEPGETVTCTFTNTQQGQVTIVKQATPEGDTQFDFDGDLGPFSLTDDGTNLNTATFSFLVPGPYLVTETALTGWDLAALACSDPDGGTTISLGTRTATIDVDPGETITCTFTNIQRGQIIVDKVTDPAGSQAIFTFDPSWGDNFTLTDANDPFNSGWLIPGPYTVEELALAGWDLSGLVCDDDDSTQDLADTTASVTLDPGETITCTFTNTQRQNLTVTKTATASYDRTYLWSIDKTVDGSDSQTIASGSATFGYNVAVAQTGYTDSGWTLSGTITIANPNSFDVTGVTVTDAYDGGGVCSVTYPGGGSSATVPANGSVTLNYSCTFASQPAYSGTNTATATWDASWQLPSTSATDTAAVTFVRDQEIDKTITVVDDKVTLATPVELGTLTASDDLNALTSETYEYNLDLPGVAGVCTPYTNTATIVETGQTDGATVTVCMAEALTVSKTASPALTRTYAWDIAKLVDETRQDIPAGGSATFNYTVNVTHDAGTDSAWVVSGTITVSNPNAFASVSGVSVSDAIVDEPNASCVVTGGSETIAAGDSATFDYTCTYSAAPAAASQTNRATVTWTSLGAGATSAQYDFPFNWTSPAVTLVDESVVVTDSQAVPTTLGTVDYDDPSPTTFTYAKTFTPTAASACTTYDNTATYTVVDDANDSGASESASQSVQVCTAADLTVSKTANPAYHRTVTWAITKDVDQTRVEIADDETATFNYTVGVTKTVVQSAWVITGTITVSNPNLWAVEVDISDTTPGGSCTVTGGENVSVPAASNGVPGTATATYECTFASNPGSGTNTATATWDAATEHTPTGETSGTATYDFASATTTTTGYDNITVSDTNQTETRSFSDSGTWQYAVVREGVGGACTPYSNTATITQTDQTASNSVTVCVGQDLTVAKTAAGTFDRTYTWDIAKAASPESQNVPAGTDATVSYGVTATQTGFVDSGWVVSGQITVANPNDWQDIVADVADSVDNGGVCTMSIGGTPTDGQDLTIPKDGSVTIDYTCTYASDPTSYSGTNSATATWDAELYNTPTGSATGTADFGLAQDGSTNKTVTVVDDKTAPANPVTLGSLTATDGEPFATQTWTYALDLAGVAGTCTDYTNTAAVKSGETTLDSASQTVEVCVGANLTVSKTASGTYDRTYLWELSKSVDTNSQNVPAGTDATFNYGVTATQTGFTDSGWEVHGTITVNNPNDWAVEVDITDAVGNGGTCTVTGGENVSVAGKGSVTVDYTCGFAAAPPSHSGTNTATATWDAETAHTPAGTASGTASFTLTQDQLTDKTVDVYDDKTNPANPVLLGTLTATDQAPFTSQLFSYTLDLTSTTGVCADYTNTATVKSGETPLDSAQQTVTVCAAADLGVSKTANTAFVRTHTWAIDKTADPTSLSLFAGGSAAVGYTVAVDKTTTDSAWVVAGQITVSNPNRFQAIVVNITDSIPNGGVCAVTDGTNVTVPAATAAGPGTVTRVYTCTYADAPDPYSATNTATATWDAEEYNTPTGTASGTVTADFGQAAITTVGYDAVNVTDTNGESWGPVSADTSWTYSETLACSRDVASYATEGHYQFTHPNTAEITETEQDADALVTVDCYAPVVSKTAQTSYTRTWSWQIDKTADVSTLNLDFWQPGTVNYQVTVSGTPVDSAWAVSGVITVVNPNPDAAMTVALTDVVSGGIAATISADADCNYSNGTLTIPAGATATCGYTTPLPNGTSRTNTATATLNQIAFSGSAPVTFGAPTNVVDETITVTDSQQGELGTVTGTGSSATQTWTYQKQVGPYAACTVTQFVNTATFVTNDTQTSGSDTWTVDVVVNCEAICDCTRLPSYWLSMADKGSRRGYDRTWDLIGSQGSSTIFYKSPYSYKLVLMLRPSGSEGVYYTLAQQYIGAELNLLQGATAPQEVVDAMYRAKEIFQQYTPAQVGAMSSSQKAELQALANTLYRYNTGFIGPGRCR